MSAAVIRRRASRRDAYGCIVRGSGGEPWQCERCGHRTRVRTFTPKCSACGSRLGRFLAG